MVSPFQVTAMQAFLQRTNRIVMESIGLAASVMLLAAAVLIVVTCFFLPYERGESIARTGASVALPPLLLWLGAGRRSGR